MQAADEVPPGAELCAVVDLIGVVALATFPVAVVLARGGSGITLAMGALTWAVAVALKLPASQYVGAIIIESQHQRVSAIAHGVVSASMELGTTAAWYILVAPHVGWFDALAFGVGASTAEIVFLLARGIRRDVRGRGREVQVAWSLGARRSVCVRHMMLIERFAALLAHVGARGLVWFGVAQLSWTLPLVAFLSFAAVDGVAVYGRLAGWNWFEPRICHSFYAFVLGVGLLEVSLFIGATMTN